MGVAFGACHVRKLLGPTWAIHSGSERGATPQQHTCWSCCIIVERVIVERVMFGQREPPTTKKVDCQNSKVTGLRIVAALGAS